MTNKEELKDEQWIVLVVVKLFNNVTRCESGKNILQFRLLNL